jgi:hypothetical protein
VGASFLPKGIIGIIGFDRFPQKLIRPLEVTGDVTQRVIDARWPLSYQLALALLQHDGPPSSCPGECYGIPNKTLVQPSDTRTTSYVSTSPSSAVSPVTPRTHASYPITRSPLESPSISASLPFNWEAAQGLHSSLCSPLDPSVEAYRKAESTARMERPQQSALCARRAYTKSDSSISFTPFYDYPADFGGEDHRFAVPDRF